MAKKQTVTMTKQKETAGTVVYGSKEVGSPVRTQYVEKAWLEGAIPESIEVTVEIK